MVIPLQSKAKSEPIMNKSIRRNWRVKVIKIAILNAMVIICAPGSVHGSEPRELAMGTFSSGSLAGWNKVDYSGSTRYALVDHEGTMVLGANSSKSATQMLMTLQVSLSGYPYIEWRWMVDTVLQIQDQTTRKSDDFPVRVYVGALHEGTPVFLCYVWASTARVGEYWPNPYRAEVSMVVVDSGDEHVGEWRFHRRNIASDFKEYAGLEIQTIIGVGLMTDTDNSGQSATARYGDIILTRD